METHGYVKNGMITFDLNIIKIVFVIPSMYTSPRWGLLMIHEYTLWGEGVKGWGKGVLAYIYIPIQIYKKYVQR